MAVGLKALCSPPINNGTDAVCEAGGTAVGAAVATVACSCWLGPGSWIGLLLVRMLLMLLLLLLLMLVLLLLLVLLLVPS